jgi:hypothetical protein
MRRPRQAHVNQHDTSRLKTPLIIESFSRGVEEPFVECEESWRGLCAYVGDTSLPDPGSSSSI